MQLYGHQRAVEYFHDFMAAYPDVRFFQPSPEKAPWHVIAEVPGADGNTRRAHFWPHKMKCSPEADNGRPLTSRVGIEAMHEVIALCRTAPDPADLFED